MTHLKEEWKSIEGHEGLYKINNSGHVISLAKEWTAGNGGTCKKKDTVLKEKGLKGKDDYGYYTLCKEGKRKNHTTHTLVFDHFGVGKRNGRKLQIDHIDDDKTNNRIDNLQLLTPRENVSKAIQKTQKPSKYVGVYWHSRDKKWGTQIWFNDKRIYLGLFKKEEDAYNEYQRALKEFEDTGTVTSKVIKRMRTNKYKGINKIGNRWQARITINGKRVYLGCFKTEYDANLAYIGGRPPKPLTEKQKSSLINAGWTESEGAAIP